MHPELPPETQMFQDDAKQPPQEDLPEGKPLVRQSCLHGRRLGLLPELQRSMESQKVVVAADYFKLAFEMVFTAGVTGRSPRQIRTRLTHG